MKRTIINAEGYEIEVRFGGTNGDFVSLTDIARYKTSENPGYVIQNWMRNRNTVRFLGLWEQFHNPVFNCLEFEAIENEAGMNKSERAIRLNQIAINQLQVLSQHGSLKMLV